MLKPMLFSVELGCARWFIIILFPQSLFLKKKYFDALKLHDSCKKINIKREWLYEPSDTINVLSKNHGKCDKNSIISKRNVGQLPFSSGKIPRLNETESFGEETEKCSWNMNMNEYVKRYWYLFGCFAVKMVKHFPIWSRSWSKSTLNHLTCYANMYTALVE